MPVNTNDTSDAENDNVETAVSTKTKAKAKSTKTKAKSTASANSTTSKKGKTKQGAKAKLGLVPADVTVTTDLTTMVSESDNEAPPSGDEVIIQHDDDTGDYDVNTHRQTTTVKSTKRHRDTRQLTATSLSKIDPLSGKSIQDQIDIYEEKLDHLKALVTEPVDEFTEKRNDQKLTTMADLKIGYVPRNRLRSDSLTLQSVLDKTGTDIVTKLQSHINVKIDAKMKVLGDALLQRVEMLLKNSNSTSSSSSSSSSSSIPSIKMKAAPKPTLTKGDIGLYWTNYHKIVFEEIIKKDGHMLQRLKCGNPDCTIDKGGSDEGLISYYQLRQLQSKKELPHTCLRCLKFFAHPGACYKRAREIHDEALGDKPYCDLHPAVTGLLGGADFDDILELRHMQSTERAIAAEKKKVLEQAKKKQNKARKQWTSKKKRKKPDDE